MFLIIRWFVDEFDWYSILPQTQLHSSRKNAIYWFSGIDVPAWKFKVATIRWVSFHNLYFALTTKF